MLLCATMGAGSAAVGSCAPVTTARRILFQSENRFGKLFVVQEGPVRSLRFGSPSGFDQSSLDLRAPLRERTDYVRYALLALAFVEARGRLLMIGLGGGNYLRHVRTLAPGLVRESVEINPAVVEVARRFFRLSRTGVAVHVADGRRFVRTARARYRIVLVDAYGGAGSYPPHLGTRGFFGEVRKLLVPGGAVVVNVATRGVQRHLDLLRTFRTVFPAVRSFCPVRDANTIAIATVPPHPTPADVARRVRALDQGSRGRYRLAHAAAQECRLPLGRGRVLEDP